MTAVVIIVIAAALAWGWKEVLDRATGEELMGCGLFVFVPFVLILAALVAALIYFT
jgi:hypothetical protein